MAKIIIVQGKPCTGKSTYIGRFPELKVVSSDALIVAQGKAHGIDDYQEAFNIFKQTAGNFDSFELLTKHYISQGFDVVYDRTNTKVGDRKPMIAVAKKLGVELCGISFIPDEKTHNKLIKTRPEKFVDPAWFPEIIPFSYDEGFDSIFNYNYETNDVEYVEKPVVIPTYNFTFTDEDIQNLIIGLDCADFESQLSPEVVKELINRLKNKGK